MNKKTKWQVNDFKIEIDTNKNKISSFFFSALRWFCGSIAISATVRMGPLIFSYQWFYDRIFPPENCLLSGDRRKSIFYRAWNFCYLFAYENLNVSQNMFASLSRGGYSVIFYLLVDDLTKYAPESSSTAIDLSSKIKHFHLSVC